MATASMGPDPTLISRKEVDALYETLGAIKYAFNQLEVTYIVTGGSLLGAIRQNSILFCDDDIDIAIIDKDGSTYERVSQNLQRYLGSEYHYSIRPWEGGDKVRPRRMTSIFVDIFTLRQYDNLDELIDVIGVKKNGKPQKSDYIQGIRRKIEQSAYSQAEHESLYPFWHFNTRKAIELWPAEVYRPSELFPLSQDLNFGPLKVSGPRMPVMLLKRAFGMDCFEVFYQSRKHSNSCKALQPNKQCSQSETKEKELEPIVLEDGTWNHSQKVSLEDSHYIPMQMTSRKKRIATEHNREQLFLYLTRQSEIETKIMKNVINTQKIDDRIVIKTKDKVIQCRPPNTTVYMDGVFDLFHIGHLEGMSKRSNLKQTFIFLPAMISPSNTALCQVRRQSNHRCNWRY